MNDARDVIHAYVEQFAGFKQPGIFKGMAMAYDLLRFEPEYGMALFRVLFAAFEEAGGAEEPSELAPAIKQFCHEHPLAVPA